MTLPPNTYGVRCEFNPGGTRYTYLVDFPHQGKIRAGDHVVVASPKGGYKVILVVDIADDLAPVDLKYMKYIVHKVGTDCYNILMHNLSAGDEQAVTSTIDPDRHGEGDMDIARLSTSPLIDEGDVDEPGNPQGQKIQGHDTGPTDGDVTRGENVPGNSME